MFSGLLVFIGHFFEELSTSASKHSFKDKVLSYTLYGLLSHLVFSVFFLGMIFVTNSKFSYNLEGLPFFLLRLVLEITQCEIVYRSIFKTDRTTFGFARILTIPLLLLVDVALGYSLSNYQYLGIGIISTALLAYFGVEHLKGKGVRLAMISSVISVLTISLYKYDISHYNSIAVSQFVMAFALSLIYGIRVLCSKRDRKLFKQLKDHKMLSLVFVSSAISTTLISYAYSLAPASLVLALSRASAVVWTLLSGTFYFHEKKVLKKVFICAILVLGLFVMVK